VPADPLALAHRVDGCLEYLAEIAADLALDPDRHHQPGEVLARVAGGGAVERVFEFATEPRLGKRPAELARDRLGAFAYERVDRLPEREAGPDRADDELQRLRQQFGEPGGAAGGADVAVHAGQQPAGSEPERYAEPDREDEREQHCATGRRAGTGEQPLRRTQVHAGPVER
jgi:hypothetical protein